MSDEEAHAQLTTYWDYLFKIAGGWLYWPLEQTLHTDINYLLLAYDGHVEQLEAIFGGGKKDKDDLPKVTRGADGKPLKMTADIFDVQFDVKRNPRAKVIKRGKEDG